MRQMLNRAFRRARNYRAHVVAVFACLLLAACETNDNLTTGSIGATPRTIAFDSIDGPPPPVFKRLVAQLSAQAESRDLPVVSRTAQAAWRVRLYLAAHVEKSQAGISWVGDVYDQRLNRAWRVSGEEPLGPGRKDVWALADNAALARIAAASLDAIVNGAKGSVPGDVPAEPQAEPQSDTGQPVASLPATAPAAFADTSR